MQLLSVQFSPVSCYHPPLRPKYLTQHPSHKRPLWETTFQTRTKQRAKFSSVNLNMCISGQQTERHKILDRLVAGIAGEKAVCAGGYWGRGVKEQELCDCYCVWKVLKDKQDNSFGTATILRDGRPRNREFDCKKGSETFHFTSSRQALGLIQRRIH